MVFNRLNSRVLEIRGEQRICNYWTSTKRFNSILTFNNKTTEEVFQFSYDMTFGKLGIHRDHRSGGSHHRKNGELFINTFQGKLAEFGLYNFFKEKGIDSEEPDLSKWGKGKWDTIDLSIKDKKLNVKSTKSKGNLLLLETKDWNNEGKYIPNIAVDGGEYDYFILTRIGPDGELLMKSKRLLYSIEVEINILKEYLLNEKWVFDIAGYITNEDLISIIRDGIIIRREDYLNTWTRMDAENYYVQSGDMRDINGLVEILR